MTPGVRFFRSDRQDLGCCEDGGAKIRAYRDTGLIAQRNGRHHSSGIGWRETIVLEVATRGHGRQSMRLSVLELDTLWRLVGRAMKWRRERNVRSGHGFPAEPGPAHGRA